MPSIPFFTKKNESEVSANGHHSDDSFDDEDFSFDQADADESELSLADPEATGQPKIDKASIADLVAKYGNSSATAWLEFERYQLWQAPPGAVPNSPFQPVQGYMKKKSWIFAWGDPLVHDPSALEETAKAFIGWVESQGLQTVWCCVDLPLEKVLANIGFSTVECIYEDVLQPEHVVELTSAQSKGKEGQHVVKDLKKNLRRADKAGVTIDEVTGKWTDELRTGVNDGVERWKNNRSGVQIAATTFMPFTDEEHRRYWLAYHESKIVGILILAHTGEHYVIKNCASFPDAPRGTSEALIHRGLEDIHAEEKEKGHAINVSFGITAADEVRPVDNLSGWKITSLSKVYHSVTHSAGLLKRADFRSKFDSGHQPMYVCYNKGFGIEGIRALLKLLRK
ncbi:hypothetical protein CYLTODRAFT_378011 [Cylindrobasidium torrendii FP15055 ss-10]|uniref:Phosphatidylglycerol lysyltransferase C-terminal domain-containing protein n=1 Tax=Cylindrobasidium torrendii FP15055 ss-10 TaxID=1314674 RepID=A0A0D7B9R6_9AGAR|nr:hypothetical protein CYLTODRAFT_378011 [Cylindrobasidium torrendii FP15055 ss-10]